MVVIIESTLPSKSYFLCSDSPEPGDGLLLNLYQTEAYFKCSIQGRPQHSQWRKERIPGDPHSERMLMNPIG